MSLTSTAVLVHSFSYVRDAGGLCLQTLVTSTRLGIAVIWL